ncbi:MAG: hypothetical protein ACI4GW_14020 [Lachnospiraceae bacterium]
MEDIVFVSDTTGSLSYILAEFDSEDNLLAAYTRADTLISQIRDELTSKLNNEKDINILKKWLKLAAKADSLEEFIKAINE